MVFVIALDDLSHGVQTGQDAGLGVRDLEFEVIADRAQPRAEFGPEGIKSGAGPCRDGNRLGESIDPTRDRGAVVDTIDLIEHEQNRFGTRPDLGEDVGDGPDLVLDLGMADVDDVEQKVGVDDFFKCRLESLDQRDGGVCG